MTETQVTENPAEAEASERPITAADLVGALAALGFTFDEPETLNERDMPRLMGTLLARVYDAWTEVARLTAWSGAPQEFYTGFRLVADRHEGSDTLCTEGCCFNSLRKLGQVFSLTSLLLAQYGLKSEMALMMPMSLGLAASLAGTAVAEPGSLQSASLRLMVENSYLQLEELAHSAGIGTDDQVSVSQVSHNSVKIGPIQIQMPVPTVRFWLRAEARDDEGNWKEVFSGGMAHVANGPDHDPAKPPTTAEEIVTDAYPQILKYLNERDGETRPVRLKVWDLELHETAIVAEGTAEPDAAFPPAYFGDEGQAADVVDAELPNADGSYGHAAALLAETGGADVG